MLDADAFDAFLESGSVFNKEVADRCCKYIYSAGNSQAPDELFRLFRGRDPIIDPMLKKKGLLASSDFSSLGVYLVYKSTVMIQRII